MKISFWLLFLPILLILCSFVCIVSGGGEASSGGGVNRKRSNSGGSSNSLKRPNSLLKKTNSLDSIRNVKQKKQSLEEEERDFVNEINGQNHGRWRAKANKLFADIDDAQKKFLAGVKHKGQKVKAKTVDTWKDLRGKKVQFHCTETVEFDARTHWPQCRPVIDTIHDQSWCGSCWAVSVAAAFSDRHCIKFKDSIDPKSAKAHFSSFDILSCSANTKGCGGGEPDSAWKYINAYGIVSGTENKRKDGCKPYPFNDLSWRQILPNKWVVPKCEKQCRKGWKSEYYNEKRYVTNIERWYDKNKKSVEKIQEEIKRNGPVVASITIYKDFFDYEKGVYAHVPSKKNRILGEHSIRLLGWGIQKCTDTKTGHSKSYPFWLAANNWGIKWGEQGFVKILRGSHEAGVEDDISFAGVRDLDPE